MVGARVRRYQAAYAEGRGLLRGCSCPAAGSPSIVVTTLPSSPLIGVMQLRVA
jgi:hypothetical protein